MVLLIDFCMQVEPTQPHPEVWSAYGVLFQTPLALIELIEETTNVQK